MRLSLLTLIASVLAAGCGPGNDFLTFPQAQWTTGFYGENVSWQFEYDAILKMNNSFISRPEGDNWDEWYKSIEAYRDQARKKIVKEEPVLNCEISLGHPARIHFNKFGYDLKLLPGEEIEIIGKFVVPPLSAGVPRTRGTKAEPAVPAEASAKAGILTLYLDFELKSTGEESGSVIRKRFLTADSLEIHFDKNGFDFDRKLIIPLFQSDSLSISPVLRLTSKSGTNADVIISDLSLKVKSTPERNSLLSNIKTRINDLKKNTGLKNAAANPGWMQKNFVMGFVYMWDREFWDPAAGKFTVDMYCKKMAWDFGGFQSVILWHSYPNIGIDNRNQFDFFHNLPGGLDGLKQVVDDFHKNEIRVLLAYNPWDLDTRRPEETDAKELSNILSHTGADGIFLDTWNSAAGMNSILRGESIFADEFAGKTTVFVAELFPEYKDMAGNHALAGSWGQQINPFHYTDLSHLKWIFPEHKQYFIERETTERQQMLTHAWINGQGIQVWENIFGSMNFWSAENKWDLRKMNVIWKSYGSLYSSDQWQPFIPLSEAGLYCSLWTSGEDAIWNFIDSADINRKIRIPVDIYPDHRFYDLWNGYEITPYEQDGRKIAEIPIYGFGCMLATKQESAVFDKFLADRKNIVTRESSSPESERTNLEFSIKLYALHTYKRNHVNAELKTVRVGGGSYSLKTRHIWREGECYPDRNAKDNHDLNIIYEEGVRKILHTEDLRLPDFSIMPSAVTNAEFEKFLTAAGYSPRFPENFLKHWNGKTCPPEIKDKPVVYISLEDARAFAEWAGMELPTEWEWQAAAEKLKDEFRFNDVFEWNESERDDGFNRFVTLRGGCRDWKTPGSWWYLPGAPYGEIAGGEQPYDSHVKYFLMYPGMDRAATIGFRCVRR